MMKKTIAIYPGAFKPYTAGHDGVVQSVSQKVDELRLLVSTGDRKRPGEFPIVWKGSMEVVWKQHIEASLPANVSVSYTNNPVYETYKQIEQLEKQVTELEVVYLVAGEEDRERFSLERISRLAPMLVQQGKVKFLLLERIGNVSGTKLRQHLADGNVEGFRSLLPDQLKANVEQIMDLLRNPRVVENAEKKGSVVMKIKLSELKKLIKEAVEEYMEQANPGTVG